MHKTNTNKENSESDDSNIYNFISPLILLFVLPALLGTLPIVLFQQGLDLLKNQKLFSEIGVFLFFFNIFILLTAFLAITVSEAVREAWNNLNYAMQRVFGILVVGLTDTFFKGRSVAASIIYVAIVMIQFICEFIFIKYVIFSQPIKNILNKFLSTNEIELPKAFLLGFLLIWALTLLVIPLIAILLPGWKNICKRPNLIVVDENKLQKLENSKNEVFSEIRNQKSNAVFFKDFLFVVFINITSGWIKNFLKSQLLLKQNKKPAQKSGSDYFVSIAHLSDMHIADEDKNLESLNHRTFSSVKNNNPDIVALTGDITDKGSIKSWDSFLSMPLILEKDKRIVIVPGNHDLNTWDEGVWRSFRKVDSYNRKNSSIRANLYIKTASSVMGERAWVLCPMTGVVRRLIDVYLQAKDQLEAWESKDSNIKKVDPIGFLSDLFPMVVETMKDESVKNLKCVVWNTVKSNRWAILNSLGEISTDQIKRVQKILLEKQFSESGLIHLMHHQIALPSEKSFGEDNVPSALYKYQPIGMGLQTAEPFLKFIRKRVQNTCILHGHQHKYFVCRESSSGAFVISAPSSKFSAEKSFSKNFPDPRNFNWLLIRVELDGMHTNLVHVEPINT